MTVCWCFCAQCSANIPYSLQAPCPQGGRASGLGEAGMGAWLRAIGLERYEEGLVHNGWDDLEFLRWGRGRRWIGWVSGLRTGLWAFLDLLDLLVHLQASRSHSDITEEDLEEAGVQDPAHKRLLLDTLQLSK